MDDREISKDIAALMFPKLQKIVAWHCGLSKERDVDYLDFSGTAWDSIMVDVIVKYPTVNEYQWYRVEDELNEALAPFARKVSIFAARQELRIAKVRTGTVYSFNSLDAMRDNQLYL